MCHSSCSSPLLRYNDIENQVSGDGPREGAMVVVVMELDRTIVVCVAAFSNLGVLMYMHPMGYVYFVHQCIICLK